MARGTRTHDNQIHNLALYQLNYSHHIWAVCPLLSFCFRKTSFLGNSPYFPTSTFVSREPCFFKYARDVSNNTCGNPIFSAHIFPLRHSSCGNPASSSMLVMYLTILVGTHLLCPYLPTSTFVSREPYSFTMYALYYRFAFAKLYLTICPSHQCYISIIYLFL